MEQSTLLDVLRAMTEEQQNSVIAAVEALTIDSVYGEFFHKTDDREEQLQMAAAVLSGRHPSKAVNDRLQKMIQDAPAAFDALSNADKEKTLQLANSILEKRADIEREIAEKNTLTEDEKAAILRTAAEIEGTAAAGMSIEDAIEICKRAYIKEQLPFMSFLLHSGAGTSIDPNLTKTDITALLREDLQQDEPAGKMSDAEAQERIQEYFIRQGEAGREDLRDTLRHLSEYFLGDKPDRDKTESFRNSVYAALHSKQFAETKQDLIDLATGAADAAERLQELEDLRPYIKQILEKPDYDYIRNEMANTMRHVDGEEVKGFPADYTETDYLLDRYASFFGLIETGSPLEAVIEEARAARAAAEKELPAVSMERAQLIEYPLDKPNSKIWNLLEVDTSGQIKFNMAKVGSKKEVPAYYAINFDALEPDVKITKRLLPFDKRVYIAISALFNAGNNVITLRQIHYAMGNTSRPADNQLEKINDAITKMRGAEIFFDNKEEADTYKNYAHFKYDGSLLPFERGTALVNGQLADAAIHIFREPPLITFAKERKQITTVEVKLLQSPVSKTDNNLLIDDYLIERISKAKNGKGCSCRILYKTLFDHANITTKKQKQRAPEKIKRYLAHYQECNFIKRFTTQTDGVTIFW